MPIILIIKRAIIGLIQMKKLLIILLMIYNQLLRNIIQKLIIMIGEHIIKNKLKEIKVKKPNYINKRY